MSYGAKQSSRVLRQTTPWEARPPIIPTAIYTLEEASFLLAISRRTLEKARHNTGEKHLSCAKIGDSTRMTGEELLRWFKAHV